MKLRLLLTCWVLLIIKLSIAQTPGGVAGSSIWYKGNAGLPTVPANGTPGVYTNVNTFWADQSGNNNHGVIRSTDATTMLYNANVLNFNPALAHIDGTDNWLQWNQVQARTIFWIGQNTEPTTENHLFSDLSSPGGSFHGETGVVQSTTTGSADARAATWYKNGAGVAANNAWTNQLQLVSAVTTGNVPMNSTGGQTQSITTCCGFRDMNAFIGEIVSYPTALNAADLNKVHSYLSIKYGLTLNNGNSNYTNSAGAVIWNSATSGPYKNEIFAIGRDDNSALNQRQSKSSNADGILVASVDPAIQTSNTANTGTFAANESFVFFSNNDADTKITWNRWNEINTIFANQNIISDRKWLVTRVNFNQDLTVALPTTQAYPGANKILVISTDGNFQNNGIGETFVTVTTAGGYNSATIPAASLPAGDFYIAFAANVVGPGTVAGDNTLWVKADAGVTLTGARIASWNNLASNSSLVATSITEEGATGPTMVTNTLNFNPLARFSGAQYMRVTNVSTNNLLDVDVDAGSVFAVYTSNNNLNQIISLSDGANANRFRFRRNGLVYAGTDYGNTTQGSPTQHQIGAVIFNRTNTSSNFHYLNGANNGGVAGPADGGNAANSILYLGVEQGGAAGTWLVGDLAEVIVYDTALSFIDRAKVSTYLAIKYGIQINGAYVVGSGSSFMWNTTADYNNGIFGIARDDDAGLNQRVSRSTSQANDVLTVALQNNFTAANNDAARTVNFNNDLSYAIIGNNNAGYDIISTDIFTSGNMQNRIAREWQIRYSRVITQGLSLRFAGFGSTATRKYHLINDADGDFTMGAVDLGVLDANGEINGVVFSGIQDIQFDNSYFTLALEIKAPGGVTPNLQLWFKADAGTSLNGANNFVAPGWINQGAANNNASAIASDPNWVNNAINFNPTVRFDADDYFDLTNLNGKPNTAGEVIVITRNTKTAGTTQDYPFDFGGARGMHYTWSDGNIYHSFGTDDRIGFNPLNKVVADAKAGLTPRAADANTDPSLYNIQHTFAQAGQWVSGFNGSNTYSTFTNTPNFDVAGNGNVMSIANSDATGAGRGYEGDIAEVALYDRVLSDLDRRRVHTYFAIKYGITLGFNDPVTNYISGDGSVVFIRNANTNYSNHIFGLARDTSDGLDQRVATSYTDNTVTLALDKNFTAANNDLAARPTTFADPRAYLLLSSNTGTYALQNTELPPAIPSVRQRIGREWRINTLGVINEPIHMRFAGYGSKSPAYYYVLLSTGDIGGDFTVPGAFIVGVLDANGEITFNAGFDDKDYFTIGLIQHSPGGVSAGLNMWLRADMGLTSNPNTSGGWYDWSFSNYHATQGTVAARPTLGNNELNFNAGYVFDGGAKDLATTPIPALVGNNPFGFFAVSKTSSNNRMGIFSGVNTDNSFSLEMNNGAYITGFSNVAYPVASTGIWANNEIHSYYGNRERQAGQLEADVNARQVSIVYNNGLFAAPAGTYRVGRSFRNNSANDDRFIGQIGEFILYNRVLTELEIQKVYTYLSLKYGTYIYEFGYSPKRSFIASNDVRVWDHNDATNNGYHRNVFGLAKDSIGLLNQRVSKPNSQPNYAVPTAYNPDILTLALEKNFTDANNSPTRTVDFPANNDIMYFMVGNNEATINVVGTELPAGALGRIGREWRVRKTNFNLPVSMKFNVPVANSRYIRYQVYKDADGDFTNGATMIGELDANGEVANLTLNDGEFFTLIVTRKTPGGVSPNLMLWLRADDGPTTTGANLNTWIDRSGTGVDGSTSATTAAKPTLVGLEANFNPTIRFNRTNNQYVQLGTGFQDFSAGVSAYVISKTSGTAGVFERFFDIGQGQADDNILFCRSGSGDNGNYTTFVANLGTNNTATNMMVNSSGFYNSYSVTQPGGAVGAMVTPAIYRNNLSLAISGTNPVPDNVLRNSNYIGRSNWAADTYFNGDIAEVILYNRNTATGNEKQRIESYLAIKYGLTINQTTPTNYLASDGSIVWNSATAVSASSGTFNKAITVLGIDTVAQWLHQKISKNSQDSDIVTIAVQSNFTAGNDDAARTIGVNGNLNFIAIANNGFVEDALISTELPAALIGYNSRLQREWQSQATAAYATDVFLKFNNISSQLPYTIATLIIDDDGDFTNATAIGNIDANGIINVPATALAGVKYFTIAFIQKAPGGITPNLGLWYRADDGPATTGGLIDSWADRSAIKENGTGGTGANATRPVLTPNAINFNPTGSFTDATGTFIQFGGNFSDFTSGLTAYFVMRQTAQNNGSRFMGLSNGFINSRAINFGRVNSTNDVLRILVEDPETGALRAVSNLATPLPLNNARAITFGLPAGAEGTANTPLFFSNGRNIGALPANDESRVPRNSRRSVNFIGRGFLLAAAENYMLGDIAEVILYNNNHQAAPLDKRRVESYLALKYGLTLTNAANTLAERYVASDGATVMWSETINNAYRSDIFGIGLDTAQQLNQKVSKSTDSDDIVTLSLNTDFTSANNAVRPNHTNNLQFLMLGNNDGNFKFKGSEIPTTLPAINATLGREWLFQYTGNFNQNISLRFTGYGNTPGNRYTTYYLIKDQDGDFTNAEMVGALDANGVITFNAQDVWSGGFITIGLSQKAPGGVVPYLGLWLRADDGPVLTGANIDSWTDRSGANKNGVGGTGANATRPTYGANATANNFNPTATFTRGNSQFVDVADGFADFTKGGSFIFVTKPIGAAGTYERLMDFGNGPGAANVLIARDVVTQNALFQGISGGSNGGISSSSANTLIQNENMIFDVVQPLGNVNTAVVPTHFRNGQPRPIIGSSLVADNVIRTNNYLGRSAFASDAYYNGDMSEIILYDTANNATALQRINTYLGIKYGISLDQTTPTNYLATDGTTIVWNATANAAYNNDIFGLANDTLELLNQKIAKSEQSDDIVTIALQNNFTSSNIDAARTINHTNDKQYLLLSNNNGVVTFVSTEVPAGYVNRIGREWRVSKTANFTQNIFMRFTGVPASTTSVKYFLIRDDDGDGDFTTGTITNLGASAANGQFSNINLANGDIITVAAVIIAPGGVVPALNFWVKADKDVTLSTNQVTTWDNQTLLNANLSNVGFPRATTPNYLNNQLNFNPTIQFTEDADLLVNTGAVIANAGNSTTHEGNLFLVNQAVNTITGTDIFSFNRTPSAAFFGYDDVSVFKGGVFKGQTNSAITYTAQPNGTQPFVTRFSSAGTNGAVQTNGVANGALNFFAGFVYNNQRGIAMGGDEYIYPFGGPPGGQDSTDDASFRGQIAEAFFYDRALTANELNRINTYLTVKYGITLADGANDMIASDGTTIVFPSTAGNAYRHDIFGIAKDTLQGLDQRVARSTWGNGTSRTDDIVTLSLQPNSFTVANNDATRTRQFNNDRQFMVIGNNNGVTSTTIAELPPGYDTRVAREWQVRRTANFTNTVSLRFDGYTSNVTGYTSYFLVTDADGDFSDGNSVEVGPLGTSGEINGVTFTDGHYFTIAIKARAPGGVVPSLVLWLRADDAGPNGTEGAPVDTWLDRSSSGANATGTGAQRPINTAGLINYNPGVLFDDADDRFTLGGNFTSFISDRGLAAYVVMKPTANNTDVIFQLGSTSDINQIRLERPLMGNTLQLATGGLAGSSTVTTSLSGVLIENAFNAYSIATAGNFTTALFRRNGASVASTGTGNGLPSAAATRNINIVGQSYSGNSSTFGGEIAELILYDTTHDASNNRRQRIESYLCLKYGLTLDQSVATNYLASDGTTVMWSAATAGLYNRDIAGIYRDNEQLLRQKQSRSSNSIYEPTISIGPLQATNKLNIANNADTLLNDKSGFVWANNGAPINLAQASDLPAGSCLTSRLSREWKIQITNGAANTRTNLQIDLTPLAMSGYVLETDPLEYTILIDGDGDGNYTTGIPQQRALQASSKVGNTIYFENVRWDADRNGVDVFTFGLVRETLRPILVPTGVSKNATTTCVSGSDVQFRDPADPKRKVLQVDMNGETGPGFIYALVDNTTSADFVNLYQNQATYYEKANGSGNLRIGKRLHYVLAGFGPFSTTNGGVIARIYYTDADTMAILADPIVPIAPSTDVTIDQHGWFKNPAHTPNELNTNYGNTDLAGGTQVIPINWGVEDGVKFVEFLVDGFSTFGYFAKTLNFVLPITLKDFNAVKNGNKVDIVWNTSAETSSAKFVVERSLDGTNFTPIGSKNAMGSGSGLRNYSIEDKNPSNGKNYYRLKTVDNQGRFVYSGVKVIVFTEDYNVFVYPNPVATGNTTLQISSKVAERVNLQLVAMDGKVIQSKQVNINSGANSIPLGDLTKLANGEYIIKVIFGNTTKVVKIMKQ